MSRMVSGAAEGIASALVPHDDRSTPRDALVYLGQSMGFAVMCAVVPCYAAWCSGRNAGYYGDHNDPAVYRVLPTDSLNGNIEHLSVNPYDPSRMLEFGVSPEAQEPPRLWESPYLVYALGAFVPIAVAFTYLFRLKARATLLVS